MLDGDIYGEKAEGISGQGMVKGKRNSYNFKFGGQGRFY